MLNEKLKLEKNEEQNLETNVWNENSEIMEGLDSNNGMLNMVKMKNLKISRKNREK
jgi:hypothetical protein